MTDYLITNGYTSVVLVVNMQRFLENDDHNQRLFASTRGTSVLHHTLQETLPQQLESNEWFTLTDEYGDPDDTKDHMPADETGFVTGLFRHNMIKEYSAPAYKLNKNAIVFDPLLEENYQFRRLFLPMWKRWDISIRPTMTGMFVIRLVRRTKNATTVLQLAKDVLDLQTSLDVLGAQQQFAKIKEEFGHDPDTMKERQQSVQALLDWLGLKDGDQPRLLYVPVQWQLAMTVCQYFLQALDCKIQLPDNGDEVIRFRTVQNEIANHLHDSYVIYHIDQVMTRFSPEFKPIQNARHVSIEELSEKIEFKQEIVNLLEGAMLRRQQTSETRDDNTSRQYFPVRTADYIESYLKGNYSTWSQEMCLMTGRTAIVMPSRKDRRAELYVSTLPATSTTSVLYLNYWDALERMLEFVSEIRVLAQLLERGSAKLLQDYVRRLRNMRAEMLNGTLHIDSNELIEIVEESANLNRLVGLCHSLANPHVWSRAEYGADKATQLLSEMRIEKLLSDAERNVNSLTNLVNHTDELYLAELSERSNRRATVLSILLGAISISIILFSLPSFWADIQQLNAGAVTPIITDTAVPLVTQLGTFFGPILILIAIVVILIAGLLFILRRWRSWAHQLKRIFRSK